MCLRVTRVSEEVVGRVYTITSTGTQGLGAFGFLVIGGLLSLLGGQTTWLILGIFSLISVFLVLILLRGRVYVTDVQEVGVSD